MTADAATDPSNMNRVDRAFVRHLAWAWPLMGVATLAMVAYMHFSGRVWWCGCGGWSPVILTVKSRHNSQHLIDAYATSHLLHGVIFFFAVTWLFPKLPTLWRLFVSVCVEVAWEICENSPVVINRYRDGTAALGYEGDSVVNSLGDLASMVAGFYVARAIGWRWSVVLFVVIELGMLWWIRDNLTLNVVMLLYPIEAIKAWQTA